MGAELSDTGCSHLVALRTSFRPGSNSTILLDAAAEGARAAGAEVETFDLAKARIGPCRACDACARTGRCRFVDDDLMVIVDAAWDAGSLLVATPIYYMAAPAQLKCLIDRTQCLYSRKYRLEDRLPAEEIARRRGGVIAVCGSKIKEAFDGLDLTMKYLFDSFQMTFAERLYVQHVDSPREIESHPARIEEARELGRRLVEGMG
ncbi:MAG: flavodoxin family protein [Planctomycetota bacterium]